MYPTEKELSHSGKVHSISPWAHGPGHPQHTNDVSRCVRITAPFHGAADDYACRQGMTPSRSNLIINQNGELELVADLMWGTKGGKPTQQNCSWTKLSKSKKTIMSRIHESKDSTSHLGYNYKLLEYEPHSPWKNAKMKMRHESHRQWKQVDGSNPIKTTVIMRMIFELLNSSNDSEWFFRRNKFGTVSCFKKSYLLLPESWQLRYSSLTSLYLTKYLDNQSFDQLTLN